MTNAEFKYFIDAGGYERQVWWSDEKAKQWLNGGYEQHESQASYYREFWKMARSDPEGSLLKFKPDATRNWVTQQFSILRNLTENDLEQWIKEYFGANRKIKPAFWDVPQFNRPSQPVVGVNWYEASAYASWLSAMSGLEFSLPTEAQWETAARCYSMQAWPWGDDLSLIHI